MFGQSVPTASVSCDKVERPSLDVTLATMQQTMLSAMAERMFHTSAVLEDTTDSECDEEDAKERRVASCKNQARPKLLPLVAESVPTNSCVQDQERECRMSRDLVLDDVPKNPWKTIRSTAIRRRHCFEYYGFKVPAKRKRSFDHHHGDGAFFASSFSVGTLASGVSGNMMELIDSEGKVVELREKPAGTKNVCCYIKCANPCKTTQFKTIKQSAGAGGFDWARYVGRTFCNACHSRMRKSGTVATDAGTAHESPRSFPRKTAACQPSASPSVGRGAAHKKTAAPLNVQASPCQVCFDAEKVADLACSKCHIAVHQQCYLGGEHVAARDRAAWQCDPCSLGGKTEEMKCVLCPLTGGAFKRAACNGEFRWAHLACAILIPGLYMMDDTRLDDIRGLESIPDEAKDRLCAVCQKQDAFFPCVSCGYVGCESECHPLCGARNGWKIRIVVEGDQLTQTIRCPKHSSQALNRRVGGRREDTDVTTAVDEIRCPICAEAWDGKQFMIRCDSCAGFYHGTCVLVSERKSKAMTRFTCPKCPVPSCAESKAVQIRGRDAHSSASQPQPETMPGSLPQTERADSGSLKLPPSRREDDENQVFPGRRILFHWNGDESFEAVVGCRASELRGSNVKRKTYGPNWWQVNWGSNDGSGNRKDVVLLAASNSDRWELLPDATTDLQVGRTASVRKGKQLTPRSKTHLALNPAPTRVKGAPNRVHKPGKRTPFQPVRVFCTGNGEQASQRATGILRVSTYSPWKVIVECDGLELALTEFEAWSGNSAKRPKSNIRIADTREPIGEYLAKHWDEEWAVTAEG